MSKRRVSSAPSARKMRQAVAYFRLAAKAHRNGETDHYTEKAIRLRDQAYRLAEQEKARKR